jgi:putative tricarboxylic transport membrane protein
MFESLGSAITQFGNLTIWVYMFVGIWLGLIFGILPGLGGMVALAVLMPFIYGMSPFLGLTFLIAAHSLIYTGGAVTAILFGIPPAPGEAATVIDGFPLALQGRGGEAVGAALSASAVGGVYGAAILMVCIWLLADAVLAFGAPEIFVVVCIGVFIISIIGRGSMLKGLISGGLGMVIGLIGYSEVTGMPRATFGWVEIYDGIPIIPLTLGLFAVPEMIALAKRGTIASEQQLKCSLRDVWRGAWAPFKYWYITLVTSVIGAIVGIIPGVGAETAPFVAYAWTKARSKYPEKFGTGMIEGVVAPETANNSKEGGALVPTLALGVPGSSGMAILLGAFWLVGVEPGPLFLKEHMDVAQGLIITLITANVLGAVFLMVITNQLAKLCVVSSNIIVPIVLVLCCLGSYLAKGNLLHVFFLLPLGLLGYGLRALGYNRPAVILGFVLASVAEKYFLIGLAAYGWTGFFTRPTAVVMILLFLLYIFYGNIKKFVMGMVRRRA